MLSVADFQKLRASLMKNYDSPLMQWLLLHISISCTLETMLFKQ